MDLQVERQMLSPGVGAAGRVGGGWLRSCGGPPLARLPPAAAGQGEGPPALHLSTGPCLCLLRLCSVLSGFMSHSSSGLWPHLTVQSADLLLVGRGQEEAAHLPLQWLLHLHVNVIARRLLLVRRVHTAGKAGPRCSPAPQRPRAWGRCRGEGREGQDAMPVWSGEQAGASPDDVVDDNWVRGQQQSCEALGNLRKLQPGTIKNLKERGRERGHSSGLEQA